jgi:hypothetical protein
MSEMSQGPASDRAFSPLQPTARAVGSLDPEERFALVVTRPHMRSDATVAVRFPSSRNPAEGKMPDAPKSRFELFVELVKAGAWPLLAAIVLASFWGPLVRTAEEMPSIVGRSESITIAGLSLKVGAALREKVTPQIQAALAKLSGDGVAKVLAMSTGGAYWDKGHETQGRSDYDELLRAGLAEEAPADQLEALNRQDGRSYGLGIRITSLGRATQSFLRSVVAEFVQNLPPPAAESSNK